MTLTDVRVSDRYPTRQAGRAGLIPRQDPVVWSRSGGYPMPGPLTRDELDTVEREGFVNLPELLTPGEVEKFRGELDRLASDPDIKSDERSIVEPTVDEVRSVFDVHLLSTRIAELLQTSRVADRARQVLGSEVYIHQSRINYKPGLGGGSFYWHSDFETWHAEDGMPSMRAVSMSIALTDNEPYNGSLMIIPGSHRTFVACQGQTPADNYQKSLQRQRAGTPDAESLRRLASEYGITMGTGPAGSALMFDCNCMHGSAGNITPFPRSNIFVVFNSVENTLAPEPFAAPRPRPEFLAHQASPRQAEYVGSRAWVSRID